LQSAAALIAAGTSPDPAAVSVPSQGAAGGSSERPDAGADEVNSTDGGPPTTSGQAGRHGRSSHGSASADGSNSTACGALALLQSVAAVAVAAPCLGLAAGAAGTSNDEGDTAQDAGMGSSGSGGSVLAAAATGASPPPPTPDAGAWPDAVATAGAGSAAPGPADVLSALGVAGGAGTGSTPTHSATSATAPSDAPGQTSAAARAASWMPQFLSAVPVAAGSDAVARAIPVPMSDPSWPQALAAQVHWMAGSQVQSATLRLSPEHLGPIQVRIELQQSQINVNFSAAHADTRAALTDALPRLREMLAAGGLSLGQASVQQESHGSGTQRPLSTQTRASVGTVDPVAVGLSRALGLVDEYV
jgi:flagellar hook-length control protein FliK